jgi:acetyltransferase-like isoleucine patch superfamily enzyme
MPPRGGGPEANSGGRRHVFGTVSAVSTWRKLRRTARVCASLAVVVLPSALKLPLYRTFFGYRIGRRVHIGWSWIAIGHGNAFARSIEFNHPDSLRDRGNAPRLVLGRHSSVTMRHYFDVSDACEVGAFTVVAGVSSILFTHFLDVATSEQRTRPIRIGDDCMLGAAVRIAPGAQIPDCCVVGMGAVVTRAFADSRALIAGCPAAIVRSLPRDGAYFARTRGWIGRYAAPVTSDDAR